jgi:clan AA aspartic protease (TIGR02281 family)
MGFQKTMICPKCHAPLERPANFCPNCGVSLQRGGGRILALTAGLVLAIVIGVYGYLKYRFPESGDKPYLAADRQSQDTASAGGAGDLNQAARETPGYETDSLPVTMADLTLKDITGRELGTYPVALVSSGWFAFPIKFCIGGYAWQVALDAEYALPVEGVILQDDEPVGLWQLPVGSPLRGLELAPWKPERPLTWYSQDDAQTVRTVPVQTAETLGNFTRISLDAESAVPGIFVQDGRLVGWSFGEWLPGGYLWTGNPGFELVPAFYTDDFYRLTFQGGREEALLLTLADNRLSDLERLTGLAEAYRLEARMPQSALPEYIAPTTIQATMRSLIQALLAQDRSEDLFLLFDPQTLLAVDQPPIASDLVTAARDAGDYAYALTLIEALDQAKVGDAGQRRTYETLQTAIYGEWLNRLIAEGDDETAREIYAEANDRFPQDPAIRLAGVELVLQRGNWAQAERLLASLNYPSDLRDTVSRLQQEISALKSQEGRIVIRFPPGSRTVPLTAGLDRGLTQRFMVDTGASLVTVPAATAQRLGIDLAYNLPRRLFYSATGVHNAIEITLPYIELNGWVVESVKALVVDLPGQPGVGLLGMNYLSNFRMDLNTDDGILMLEPR